MLLNRAPRGVLDASRREIRNCPPLESRRMFDKHLCSAVTRVSRRCARVRPRVDFEAVFVMANFPSIMYGRIAGHFKARRTVTHVLKQTETYEQPTRHLRNYLPS